MPNCLNRSILAILSLYLLASPAAVFAHAGHGDEFHRDEATPIGDSITVDPEAATRMGIAVETVAQQQLDIEIQTTGQIETLPNQKVEVRSPASGTLVELLVKPGDRVERGQPVAVFANPELAQLRVEATQKRAEGQGELQQAQADLQLALGNLQRQQAIAAAEIQQAKIQLAFAQEKYDRDQELVAAGGMPRRQLLETETKLAEAKALAAKASSRLPVLEAENQLQRAKAAVAVAQSRLRLSSAGYEARLRQLGTAASDRGLVAVTAPISGMVADREITPGEAVNAAEKVLMTIINDSSVLATANIYEKDLGKIKLGQSVQVKVASFPDRIFTGKISFIGAAVNSETRVIPVQAEINNAGGKLKPGMFANLEIATAKTPAAKLVIPTSAIVDVSGKKTVYVQNGAAFVPVEVTLGQTAGDLVAVESGLFAGDLVVTQRATQLYAQSLRSPAKHQTETAKAEVNKLPAYWWLAIPASGAIAAGIFWLGVAWARRGNKLKLSYEQKFLAANLNREAYASADEQISN